MVTIPRRPALTSVQPPLGAVRQRLPSPTAETLSSSSKLNSIAARTTPHQAKTTWLRPLDSPSWPPVTYGKAFIYSSAPLAALAIGSGTLFPYCNRGMGQYAAEVPNDVEVITLDATGLAGYQTDFLRSPSGGVVMDYGADGCAYSYGDGATTGIVLSDASTGAEGFQVNSDRGENRLGIGINWGEERVHPGGLYALTATVQNSPATGAPTIGETAQVGGTLTANTSGIADEDGLENAIPSHRWLADADGGKAIKAWVSFTDDAGYYAVLTSAATDPVVARSNSPGTGPSTIGGLGAPPVVDGPHSVNYAENATSPVARYSTDDPEEDAITWGVSGRDGPAFSIDDGVLEFRTPPNYERPADNDADNEYQVDVVATDSSQAGATIAVTVKVTDVRDPNIVLIMADDVGYEAFGSYGSTQYRTPRLDELASAGVRFTHAYSKPVCTPSRVALMTGKSNVQNYADFGVLLPGQYTFADLFRDAGYMTAIAGKWQLHGGKYSRLTGVGADEAGFDTYCLWNTDRTGENRYWNPSIECDGQVIEPGQDTYGPDIFTDFLLEFIESSQDGPFFAYYPMVLPHSPFVPPPDAQCRATDDEQCNFEDMVSRLDHNVGRIHDRLAALELLDNTILVFTSDNGTNRSLVSYLDGVEIHGDKNLPTDGGTRVPLIAVVPGGEGGRVIDDLIDFTDFLPTLAAAAALTIPEDVALDGVSFWERLQGNNGHPREWIYTYYFPWPYASSYNSPAQHPEVAYARDKRYKLYSTGELFDLFEDRHEIHPLPSDHEDSLEVRTRLQVALYSMPAAGQEIRWSFVNDGATSGQHPLWRPVLKAATVHGNELTLTYAGTLNTNAKPTTDAFEVQVDGTERTVSAVSMTANAVTLALASPVTVGQTVTVSYMPGTNALQHVKRSRGNTASALVHRGVKNETPQNSPSPGAPTISGTAQVGETLRADTSGIADADGLENATFSYQWLANDGTSDTEITGATAQTYTPSDADAGKSIRVRVSFIDDAGNAETLTAAGTDPIVTWSATLTVGEDTSVIPRTSGYSAWGMDGTLSTDTFTRGGTTYRVRVLAHKSDGLVLVVDRKLQADFTLGIGDARYERGDGSRPSTKFTDAYWWGARDLNWSAGDAVEVSLTLASGSDASLPELPLAPPTAYFRLMPETHNGVEPFTFRLHFSEDIATGREAFRDHSLEVTGGSVTGVERVNGLNRLWEITVAPDPTGDVTVALPAGVACEVAGAICTADGRQLHNRPELTVAGPEPVSEQPPDGEEPPADELTAVWSATMTVEWVHWGYGYYSTHAKQAGSLFPASFEVDGTTYTVSMIEASGWMYIGFDRQLPFGFVLELDGARFASDDASFQAYSYGNVYQWRGTDLSWNDGDTVAVRLLRTAPDSRAVGAPTISGTAQVGETLTANTSGIADPDGLAGASFAYQWMARGRDIAGADGPSLTLTRNEVGRAIRVRVSFTDDAGNKESVTSEPTVAVAALPNNRATGAPFISGMARVDHVLSVHTSGIADGDGLTNAVFAYQWMSGGTDIDGANGPSFTLTVDEQEQSIRVRVGFTDAAGYPESLTSSSTMTVRSADPCPGTSSTPTPRSIAVEAVPIVVESTNDKYYVLYVRHELDADTTVEIPVSVTLGQAGTTTLSEQLSPLPPERYRVDEFLIAEPGDIDGDCIDDITELSDPAGMNPRNPAPAVEFVDGVVAIPDRETFEALSYQGRRVVIDKHLRGLEFVKFYLFRMDTDRPVVYFMNTETHRAHSWFGNVIGLWHNPLWLQGAMKGEIVYHPNVVAPNGSLGVYRFEFEPQDAYPFEAVAYAYEVLAASMPLIDDNFAYYPMPARALPLYHEERALYDASRVDVLLEEDIFPDVDFIPLNEAEGYGFLRVMALEERPNPRDVVIYETLPNELSRVAGIITTVPQTPLSHVNLRAVQDGVPNAFIRDALDDDDIDDLIDSYVHYTVDADGWTLRAATPTEVDAHYAASRPAQPQTPERDLSVTQITALDDIEFGDWTAFGVKAANVAVLGTLGFPDGTVPDGFAVPFHFYDEFMKHNGFYDDVEEMLADPEFQSDFDTQAKELKKLRKKVKKGETPQWIMEALEDMHATYPEGQSLRYRSSTNNEDLPGFSGAGLYDSKTQDPEETEEDGIDKSIKGVWASLWNFRAFTEREFHRIDHLAAAMGVLVHPNYSDELANGVAVSFDPFGRGDGSYYVNTQLGEDLVTNPEAHSVPEEMLLHPDGTYTVTARSNQVPAGQLLMSDAQLDQLRRHLETVHDEFADLYGIGSGAEFAMEIEFKITSENVLAIKQARPWVFSVRSASSAANNPATGAPAVNGSAWVGETLTVDIAGIADADGLDNVAFAYQWLADDADINGAIGAAYTLVAAEEGKAIKVEVSFTDDGGNAETLTSEGTEAVAAANTPATGAPAISGTAQVGETLTANTSGIADADGLSNVQYEYQWLADDAEISGATNATYTLVAADEGKAISVSVSFTDDAGNDETLTSAATAAVAGAQPTEPPTKPKGLSATATHDSVTLTWDDPDDDSITGYVILRRIPGVDPEGQFDELVADTGTAATTYIDDTVRAETRYTYRIKAINGAGTSERSRWYHIDVPAAPEEQAAEPPDKPTGLEATESHGQVVLTWDDPGDDSITGYAILRRVRVNNTGGDFSVLVADTGTAATTYTDDTVATGLTYTYRIKAINEHGVSERSRWYHIDIPEAP